MRDWNSWKRIEPI